MVCFFLNNGLTMAFLKLVGTCPVLRDWLIMDVIMSIRESRHWNKRVVGIGSETARLRWGGQNNFSNLIR